MKKTLEGKVRKVAAAPAVSDAFPPAPVFPVPTVFKTEPPAPADFLQFQQHYHQ